MGADSSVEPKPGSPSFFKVVRYPSAPHLKLPIAFVRRYFDKIPKNPRLKTATGEHSWILQIKKIGEDYCFADGWEKLAKDVELRIRDILVFWLIDSSTFQVSFFDEHGCEKDLPLNEIGDCNEDDDEHYDDNGDDDNVSVTRDEDLYFQKVISTKTHRYQMLLPKKFVDDAGIEKKKSIKLKNDEGKEWIISVRCESYKSTRYYLSSGWQLFLQYHELSDGDMCLFRYIRKEDVIILAQLIKSKRPTDVEKKIGEPVKVKIEYDSDPQAEMLKRKRKRPVVEKHSGGGVEVKSDVESWPEVGFLKRKKRPPLEKPHGGGGGGGEVTVKIEDESDPPEVEVVKKDRKEPPAVKAWGGGGGGGGVEEITEPVFRFDRVIYF